MIIDSFVSYYIKEIIGIPFIGTFTATIFVEGIKQLVYKVLKTFWELINTYKDLSF